ncbi:MAG: endolytic transglycosylase MltG [Acidimicrobiales bacterium]
MTVDTAYDLEDDEFDDHYDTGQRRRWPMVLLVVLLAMVVAGGLGAAWLRAEVNPSGPPGNEIRVTIAPGQSTAQIGTLLQRRGVIRNATVFSYYARFTGADSIKAGDFVFHHNQHLAAVVDVLSRPSETQTDRVTVPEGLTLKEIAAKVGALPGRSADRFLAAAQSGTIRSQFEPAGSNNLEGLILPETYFVDRNEDEAKMLTRMVTAFDELATSIGLPDAAARLNLSPYQVVIVASMVEREAKVEGDRAPIARVIYNRLQKGMLLQVDATIQYALGTNKRLSTQGPNADTRIASPYNTYANKGLPPGPIASPGRMALQAALDPPPSSYLYYVLSDANGKHAFATTDAEFARLEADAKAKGLL